MPREHSYLFMCSLLYNSAYPYLQLQNHPQSGFCSTIWKALLAMLLTIMGEQRPIKFIDYQSFLWRAVAVDPGLQYSKKMYLFSVLHPNPQKQTIEMGEKKWKPDTPFKWKQNQCQGRSSYALHGTYQRSQSLLHYDWENRAWIAQTGIQICKPEEC